MKALEVVVGEAMEVAVVVKGEDMKADTVQTGAADPLVARMVVVVEAWEEAKQAAGGLATALVATVVTTGGSAAQTVMYRRLTSCTAALYACSITTR